MSQTYYSVEQVADLLGLHVRTVRGYVRDGKLQATRIGKQYRVAREDLEAFTGAPAETRSEIHAEATTAVRVEGVSRDTAHRIANTVSALLNGPASHGLHVQTVYDEERSVFKVMMVGDLDATAEILKVIQVLTEDGR